MDTIMYLKRLEDFTPKVALKALKSYMSNSDLKHIRISTRNLNLIRDGICDCNMVKYVVSIGDALYQIVAIDSHKIKDERVSVVVDYFQVCGIRRWTKELSMKLKDFKADSAFDFLRECMSEFDSSRARLTIGNFNLICYGICDSNMIKYAVSTGYGLYQIVAIEESNNLITVIGKYSQI